MVGLEIIIYSTPKRTLILVAWSWNVEVEWSSTSLVLSIT